MLHCYFTNQSLYMCFIFNSSVTCPCLLVFFMFYFYKLCFCLSQSSQVFSYMNSPLRITLVKTGCKVFFKVHSMKIVPARVTHKFTIGAYIRQSGAFNNIMQVNTYDAKHCNNHRGIKEPKIVCNKLF